MFRLTTKRLVLLTGILLAAGCATGGSFESYDDNDDGRVSKAEADGDIYYFDSYDKDKDGGLDAEEFRWAYAASENRRDKKAGAIDAPQQRSGGIFGSGGAGGGFGQ